MTSEEERQASLEYLASKQRMIEEALGHSLFEEREEEKAALAKAEAEMIEALNDRLGELTEEEHKNLDAECDRALEAEMRKAVFLKARQLGRTETITAILASMTEQELQSKREAVKQRMVLDARKRERFLANTDGRCTKADCKIHGKKKPG